MLTWKGSDLADESLYFKIAVIVSPPWHRGIPSLSRDKITSSAFLWTRNWSYPIKFTTTNHIQHWRSKSIYKFKNIMLNKKVGNRKLEALRPLDT